MKKLALLLLLVCGPASGLAHGQSVDLTANVQGVLPITNGGTGNAAGMPQVGTLGFVDSGVLGWFQSSINGYNQVVAQNTSNGNAASSDFVVANNLGTATTFYGDFGINSSTFAGSGSFALPSATYLYSSNGDLALGTNTANAIHFVVNNGGSDAFAINASGNATFNGNITAPGLLTSGTISGALCVDASAHLISNASGNCYAQSFPSAGIANSTGSVWGTSYTTTGSGPVLALATSPTFVTPALGTPSSATLTNATGLPIASGVSGLGTGVASALGSAVSGSGSVCLTTSCVMTTPNLGTPSAAVLTNASGTAASLTAGHVTTNANLTGDVTSAGNATTLATVNANVGSFTNANITVNAKGLITAAANGAGGAPVIANYITGFTLSNDGTTPNTILDVAVGNAADSTNASMITGSAFKKTTGGTWVAGTGNAGMGTGLTVAASTWYHVFAIINSGSFDVYFDTSASAANKPAGTTAFRYIGSFKTNGSSNILTFVQTGNYFYWQVPPLDLNFGAATTATLVTLSVPPGFNTLPLVQLEDSSGVGGHGYYLWQPSLGSVVTGAMLPVFSGQSSSFTAYAAQGPNWMTNTSSQLYYFGTGTSPALTIVTLGYVNPHVASTF